MRISTVIIKGVLSPKAIYEDLLGVIGKYIYEKKHNKVDNLLFDLSKCTAVEGNAIPNLLCIGQIIKKTTNTSPFFYCMGTEEGKRINGFLDKLNFYNINENIKVYDVKRGFSSTDVQYPMPEYCTTIMLMLDSFLSEEELTSMSGKEKKDVLNYRVGNYIARKYSEFFFTYCGDFVYWWKRSQGDREEFCRVNLLEQYAIELAVNALLHGETDCFLTIQCNESQRKISIAIADAGQGIYKSIENKIRTKDSNPLLQQSLLLLKEQTTEHDLELRTIIAALIYRKAEGITGLHEMLDSISEREGTLIIHSGKTRVILKDYALKQAIKQVNTAEDIINISERIIKEGYVKTTKWYEGTHIEIEMPMEMKINV